MKRLVSLTSLLVFMLMTTGCHSHKKYHSTDMPDPHSYNAHFGDMDTNGDGFVKWEEFAAHFENAELKVFEAIDLDRNGSVDHDEWHEFKAAHGLKHHD